MGFYYVTGITGAGKSTVCKELVRRGIEAYEGDDKLSAFYYNETGQKVDRPVTAAERTPEWRAQHTWKMSVDKLKALKTKSADKPIFVCGVTSNEDEYIDLFDKVFALVVDENTLRHRLTTRDDEHAYGKNEHEMAEVLNWQKYAAEDYHKKHAHIIDATKPLDEVVEEILANAATD